MHLTAHKSILQRHVEMLSEQTVCDLPLTVVVGAFDGTASFARPVSSKLLENCAELGSNLSTYELVYVQETCFAPIGTLS